MNAYLDMLDEINAGTNGFIIAVLSIMYWLVGAAGMTDDNLADVMARIGFTYDTATNIMHAGEAEYSIYSLLYKVIDETYPEEKTLNTAFLKLTIIKVYKLSLITAEQKTTLLGAL